jgi:hypothetical protein
VALVLPQPHKFVRSPCFVTDCRKLKYEVGVVSSGVIIIVNIVKCVQLVQMLRGTHSMMFSWSYRNLFEEGEAVTMFKFFTVMTTTVLFNFISLHQALHVSTTTGHPQVLQIFVYNYQTVTFTFTFVYMWFLKDHIPDIGSLKSCVIYQ